MKYISAFVVLVCCSTHHHVRAFLVSTRTRNVPSTRAEAEPQPVLTSVASTAEAFVDDTMLDNLIIPMEEQKLSRLSPTIGLRMRMYWHRYMQLLDTKPVRTKAVTAAVIAALGNVLSQALMAYIRNEAFALDTANLATFTLANLVYVGPWGHYLYEQLWKVGRFMENRFGCSKRQQVVAQVFLDQTVGLCIFFPLYFLSYEIFDALVTGRPPLLMVAQQKCAEKLVSIFLINWKIWPLANLINFGLVPQSLRNLYTSVLGVFWNAFLSLKMA